MTLTLHTMQTTHSCLLSTYIPNPFQNEMRLPYTTEKLGYPGIKDAKTHLPPSNLYPPKKHLSLSAGIPNPSCICSSFWLATSSVDGLWFTFQPSPCPWQLRRKSLGPFHGWTLSGFHYQLWILKEINPEYLLEGLMLKQKLQYFGHLMQRADSLEKTLMLGNIEGKRRRGQQKIRWLDSITNSLTWILVNSRR